LPLALLGGVLAARFAGDTVTLGSVLAFLVVLGITARSAVALVGRYQHLREVDGVPFGPDLIERGARERLLPVVLTALTITLAFLPLLITGQIAGQEVVNPIASVVVGGLFTSALVTLFLIPGLYLRFGGPSASAAPPEPAR
jgi:Cu/Ag efflux pump CusA